MEFKTYFKDKINNTEFIIPGDYFPDFVEKFKALGLKQKTEWGPEYYPENLFGDEIAIFELYDSEIQFERDQEKEHYRFELEEPILTEKENSIIS